MKIRLYLSFYLSVFIILKVSELNATGQQQNSFNKVCGKPVQTSGLIVHGKDFKRGEFPWMVALLHKQKNPARFFGAGTLISMRHVITGNLNLTQIKSCRHSVIRNDFEFRSMLIKILFISGTLHHAKTWKSFYETSGS